MKKIIALILALVMMFSFSILAFAVDESSSTTATYTANGDPDGDGPLTADIHYVFTAATGVTVDGGASTSDCKLVACNEKTVEVTLKSATCSLSNGTFTKTANVTLDKALKITADVTKPQTITAKVTATWATGNKPLVGGVYTGTINYVSTES